MKHITLFRADDYFGNMGNLIGFFSTREEAENELEHSIPTTFYWEVYWEGDYSQITEFTIPLSNLEGIELSDKKRMLEDDIWGAGKIVNDYYYI